MRPGRRREWRLWPVAVLVVLGIGWGITQPLAKIAVSTGHQPFGLVFWQLVIGAVVLGGLCLLRGARMRPTRARLAVWTVVALMGTVLPNAASYLAVAHLPSGVMSIVLSLVPIFAFPVALALGIDRFAWMRLAGLLCGLLGVVILIAPEASLPDPAMIWWVPVALVAPFFYGCEGNVVARWGTAGMDGIEVLAGASTIGALIVLPVAAGSGQFIDPFRPWAAPEWALTASALVNAAVYSSYLWMIARTGAVFAAQVSYLVTAAGICWAMLILGERYSGWIWLALLAMFAGLALVQPRPAAPRVAR